MHNVPEIVYKSNEVSLEPGHRVFSQGQHAENFLVVTRGSVTVFARSSDGREVVLYRVHEGEMCILTTACLIGHTEYPAEGVTDSETSALVIPASQFEELMNHSQSFREFVFRGLSERLAQVTLRFEHVVLESVQRRLTMFLLARRDADGHVEITHERLAMEIGTAREVVSRHLKAMETRGLVRTRRGQITVLEPLRLSEANS